AAGAGAVSAVLVFTAIVLIEQTYRVLIAGRVWNDWASPPEVMVGLLVLAITCAAGAAFVLARAFQRVLQQFMVYLDDAGTVRPRGLDSVVFKELRRLRVAVTRRVSHLRRENERLRNIAFVEQRTGLPNTIAL